MTLNKIARILGFRVDRISYAELIGCIERFIELKTPHTLILLNPYLLLKAKRLPEYEEYIKGCDIVTADGMGLLLAGWLYGHPFPERVTGTDLMPRLAERAAERGWRVYFLGARSGVAEKAYRVLRKEFPGFSVVGIRDGYFSKEEEREVVNDITKKKPDILIVCLGAHKQETFIQKHLSEMNVPVAFGNGAAFDFIAETVKRAPMWMQKCGLEWLFRLSQEPRRLWKRYLIANTVFTWLVLREFLKVPILGRIE